MQIATRQILIHGGLAAILLVASPSTAAVAAAAAASTHSHSTGGSPAAAVIAVPDTLWHVVQSGDHLHGLASRYRAQGGWYNLTDCLQAIRSANGMEDRDLLRPGDRLLVPMATRETPARVAEPSLAGEDLRGLYLPAAACGHSSVFDRIDGFVAAGGNGVIFDAKDIDGGLTYRSQHPLASYGEGCHGATIADLPGFVDRLHQRDVWVVARLALFLDGRLGAQRPDLALADSLGAAWTERGCSWMDAARPEVRDYNLSLALELAAAGVDEIQVDYVRFPTNGWRGDWQGDLASTAARRRGIITDFVATLHDTLAARDCRLSAAIFGIAAWGRTEDLALTGQHVPSLAPHLDVICPMIYPSHFEPGFEGLDQPADHPDQVITAGVQRCRELAGPGVLVRPWLQAFAWRVSDYGSQYVQTQIDAATRAGASGWSLWNPAGRYEVATTAMVAILP